MTNERSRSRRVGVDRARHQLLARAAFALNQNRRPARRRLDDQIEHLAHPRAAADDVRELVIPLLDVLAERPVLVDEAAPLHRVAHDDQHFVVLERLGDVVERAALHRRDGALDRRVRGDDDDGEVLVDALQLVERRDAVEAGHHDVDDGRVERQRARQLEALGARRREPHVVAFPSQQRLENLAHDLLVVDDEDRAFVGGSHASSSRSAPRPVRAAGVSVNRVPWPTALSQRIDALMLAHDAVDDRQAEPGAAADGLRREERIVDARELLRRDARTRVGDLDDGLRRRRSASTTDSQPPLGIASRAFRNRFRNTCCSWCSMPGDDHRRRRQLAPDLDAAHLRTGARAARTRRSITALRSTDVRSASPEPGRDSVSRPLTIFAARNVCFSIFSSRHCFRIAGVGPVEQHLRKARDAGQRRVHLVRDARRQQADRRHLLGNLQLLLEPHAIRDVLEQENRAGHVGVRRSVPAAAPPWR